MPQKRTVTIPVRPAASAIRKVLYDIKVNRAVSKRGNRPIFVSFVSSAVRRAMAAPNKNEPRKTPMKIPILYKKLQVCKYHCDHLIAGNENSSIGKKINLS